jgi:glycyl-tRNA synthetase beta chain
MQENQKYFPVKNADGSLRPYFITFSNIQSTRPQSIQDGNERVVTPRLSDAEFFWKQDRKKSLADFSSRLETIVFQEKLGTVAQKVSRLVKLAETIASQIGADVELAKRAAFLAKNDLMTEMVGEFGNLQGIMGRYYALADGENPPKFIPPSLNRPITACAFLVRWIAVASHTIPSCEIIIPRYVVAGSLLMTVPYIESC